MIVFDIIIIARTVLKSKNFSAGHKIKRFEWTKIMRFHSYEKYGMNNNRCTNES